MDLLTARQQAAEALEAGRKLAERALQRRRGLPAIEAPRGAELGALIGAPAAYWAGASVSRIHGGGDAVESLTLATQLAAARLAAGDMQFVRESLIGQAQWLSVLAVQLISRGDGAKGKAEEEAQFVKLALAAQRQAAQCLASAAALDRLEAASEVTVGT